MAMNEDFNFAELCRLCSLKGTHPIQIFDKEAEQQQLLFKIRSCIPTIVVSSQDISRIYMIIIVLNDSITFTKFCT